ncbi:MAG: ribosome hibernation-promoting factor, HPF/YfiA family [Actinomycetota bacterium]
MEINISARNFEVSDRFREYVADRSEKVSQLSHRASALNIKVTRYDHSKNSGPEDRVELTVIEPGHVIRAEAQAADKFAAFDIAFGKLSERLRRVGDRHKVHRGRHRNLSASELSASNFAELDVTPVEADILLPTASTADSQQPEIDLGESPVVIRRKEFKAEPMTVDDALYHMELVGHDFFLFHDSETNRPTVVYRRKGWDYGVISLS